MDRMTEDEFHDHAMIAAAATLVSRSSVTRVSLPSRVLRWLTGGGRHRVTTGDHREVAIAARTLADALVKERRRG